MTQTIKVLYNSTYGGFGFSDEFQELFEKKYKCRTIKCNEDGDIDIMNERTDDRIIKLFEQKGSEF